MANLNEKCITSNHRSTEYYLDQVGLGSIPNIVVINISLRQSTQFDPPSYSETGYGYWRLKAQDCNIGGSTTESIINPSTLWSDGTTDGNISTGSIPLSYNEAPNESCIITPGPETVPTYLPDGSNISKGKWFIPAYMSTAVDSNGVDISLQSLTNWDDKVSDIMICDNVAGIGNVPELLPLADIQKNTINVFVRLKEDFIFPGEDVTINVDVRGEPEWFDLWPLTVDGVIG